MTSRVALITGAGSGIGKAMAECFSAKGWTVFRVDVAIEEGAHAIRANVRHDADWEAIGHRIGEQVGHLDVLVNNAGILREASLEKTTTPLWDEVMEVNLKGAFLGCRTMLPWLRKGTSAAILNVSSVDALRGSKHHSAYAASKGGVLALTRALALELAPDRIRVNALCPGTVDTPMVDHILNGANEVGIDRMALHPLGRLSTPQDQAAAAAFLCSADADFITGVALSVDGGRAIR
jgi:NAD(P)-dependent dehydrogenase (short-subunit alcohol dehydrogenase family)